MGVNQSRVQIISRALLDMKLDLEHLQAIGGLQSSVYATLANQKSSPKMLKQALQLFASNRSTFSLWDWPKCEWYWNPDEPLHLINAVVSMQASSIYKRSILNNLGLLNLSTFPHWKKLWEESSGTHRDKVLRYMPERFCADHREMTRSLVKLRPSETISVLQVTPQGTLSDEEVRDLLLNLPPESKPSTVKAWLDGAPEVLAKHTDKLLWMLDARPGLCKLLSAYDEWLPLIARTSHWDPANLDRLPISRVRGARNSHAPFSVLSMVRAAVLHPNATTKKHKAAAAAYVNRLVLQKQLTKAAAGKLLAQQIVPWKLPWQHSNATGWDTSSPCKYMYMLLRSDELPADRLPGQWSCLNGYRDDPTLAKRQNIGQMLDETSMAHVAGFISPHEKGLRPAVEYLRARLRTQTWTSSEEFARAIALLEDLMPEMPVMSMENSTEYFEQVKLAVDTAVELAGSAAE